jgi:hypothetical protein
MKSDNINQASKEFNKKIKENPTRVATEELQLHDLVNADA